MSNKQLDELRQEYEAALAKANNLKEKYETLSGIPIEPLQQPERADETYTEQLGFPGVYPFTRGVYPNMYRGRHWTMRMYSGYATAEESNRRYRYLIDHGGTGLSVAFDLPTQMGYDSDADLALGEVGKAGVAIDSLADMELLFDQIPLDKVSTSMTINATASTLLAFYIAVAAKQGVSTQQLSGTIQNDILKEYAARGTYIFPPEPSMRIITDVFSFCKERMPHWNTISISGYHIREAGSTAVQEVAFTLAHGLAYVEAAIKSGLVVDDFAPRLSFFFNAHNNFFEEVAKFRAARRLWARLMRTRYQASDDSCRLRFHTQTGGSTLTAQQIDNNVARVAYQAMAAVLGGTQSLHTNGRDEALALPTESAARLALRTQQVLAYESGVTDFVDPLAGSYTIEYLTDEIEKRAQHYIETIDAKGGAVKALEAGYIQKEIQDSAFAYQRAIEDKKMTIVGVNAFQIEEEEPEDILTVTEAQQKRQIQKVKKLKEDRDNDAVARARANLKTAAQGTDNLMPLIINAVKCYTTLGEISDTLREVFGTYRDPVVL